MIKFHVESGELHFNTSAGSLPAFLGNLPQKNSSCLQSVRSTFLSSDAMSAAERMQSTNSSHKVDYTVKQTAKVHREKQQDLRPSIWLSVVKWVFGIFLFVCVLTCLVASKISLLSIASFRDEKSKANQETIFIMIILALMIPEAVSFGKACWTSLFRKKHKWPRGRAILVVSICTLYFCRTLEINALVIFN